MKDRITGLLRKTVLILLKREVFFLLTAFLLIQLWFSKNLLFGGAEAGIPTYAPGKILDQIKWTWWEALGPGVSIPTVTASIPLYAFMAILEHIGLSAIAIQKILFFIIIYLQGLGASLVFKTVFPKSGKLPILAGLFYILNPYMMIYIWHRFIYTYFILSAVLPLLIYFYLQLLDKERLRHIFYFLLISFASSYMFSAIAPVVAVWLAILSIYITAVVINRSNIKKLYRATFLSLLLFIFWLTTNFWWIYPLSQNQEIFKFFSTQSNVEVLVALSEKSTISNVVRGINPYNLFLEQDWGAVYKDLPFQILSWIPFTLFLFGLVASRRVTNAYFMIILFIFGVFMAKGTAGPLGFINSWLYSHFFILGAVKNPFEKLGLLVFLPVSIFAAAGINSFLRSKKPYLRVLAPIAIFGCALYVWPMWSDKLFGSVKFPPFFNPPADFIETSDFLSDELKKDEGKILHLPIKEGDSTTYLWPDLYNGTDLASHLFPGVSISRLLYVPFVDSTLKDAAKIFSTGNYQMYDRVFRDMGVKYIVLNKDIDWFFRDVDNPGFIEDKLDKFNYLLALKETEHFKIYKYTGKVRDILGIPQKVTFYQMAGDGLSGDLDFMEGEQGVGGKVYLELNEDKVVPGSADQKIFLPKRVIIERAELRDRSDFIPPTYYEKYLPGSVFHPFISVIEEIQTFLTPAYDKPLRMLLLTTKRLREAARLSEQDKESLFNNSIQVYSDSLEKALMSLDSLKSGKINDERLYLSKHILRQEMKDLENILKFSKEEHTQTLIKNDLKKIDEFNKNQGFALIYPISDADEFISKDGYSYQFSIKDGFKGNLITRVSNTDYIDSLNTKGLFLFIDGQKQQAAVKRIDSLNWFDLGEVALEPGDHEITVPVSNDNNMVMSLSQFKNTKGLVEEFDGNKFKINSLAEGSWVDYRLPDYNPEEKYLVRFYYRVVKGNAPVVEIIQEKDGFNSPYNDKIIRTKDIAKLDFIDSYDFDWKYFETSFGRDRDVTMRLARSTRQPVVRISVPVWNNCESNNLKNKTLCADKEFREKYNRPSIVEFRDLKITKLLHAQLYLRGPQTYTQTGEPKVEYSKVSPVEYTMKIDSPNPNFYIIFNESYHPGWKLEFNSGGQTREIGESNHYLANGYANGWFISEGNSLLTDQTGKMNLKIKFVPQDYLNKGIIVSIAAYLIIIFLMIGKRSTVRRLR